MPEERTQTCSFPLAANKLAASRWRQTNKQLASPVTCISGAGNNSTDHPAGRSYSIDSRTTTKYATTGTSGIGCKIAFVSFFLGEHKVLSTSDPSALLLLRFALQLPQSPTTGIFERRVGVRDEQRFPSDRMDNIVNQGMAPERCDGTGSVGQGCSARQANFT